MTPVGADPEGRSKKVVCRTHDVERPLATLFLQAHTRPPERIVLDLDATDDPIHCHQFVRFFQGYHKNYCDLPWSIFRGNHPLRARLRPTDIDVSAGAPKQLERIVAPLRREWALVKVVIRADSGFCREPIMAWREQNSVDHVRGLARDPRLVGAITAELEQARRQFEATK